MGASDLLIVAGEASGDLLAARMLRELAALEPDLRPFGLGGDELRAAGLEAVAHSSEISVIGITEALGVLRRAWQIHRRLLAEVDRRRPAAAVLVDFPDFNLFLARRLAAHGLEVVYYVSPQVWAWRRRRVRTIARVVDRMLVVFPFEVDFYRRHGVEAMHVGHPLVDEVPELPQAWDAGLPDGPARVALLPGSRRSEVEVLLPILLAAGRLLADEVGVRLALIRAPTLALEPLAAEVEASGLEVEIVSSGRMQAIAGSHLALCAAGTATLEVGLLGTPMIVTHKLGPWTAWLGRRMLKLPHASLVNLILERPVVPELLQEAAEPRRIAAAAAALLSDGGRIGRMRSALAELRPAIGPPGASRRAAEEVARCLARRRAAASAGG